MGPLGGRGIIQGPLGIGGGKTQTTIVLQPSAGIDTEIVSTLADRNFGTFDSCNAGGVTRGLIKFDLSTIPAGSAILVATLSLYRYAGATGNVAVHRSLVEWFEGVKNNAPPDPGQDGSTWNLRNANGAVAWAGGVGGGSGSDYAAVATAITNCNAVGFFDWNVLADVAAWMANPAINYGWWTLGPGGLVAFYSSDHVTANQRPKLTITYS